MKTRITLALLALSAKGMSPVQILEVRAPSSFHPLWIASTVEARAVSLIYDNLGRMENGKWATDLGELRATPDGVQLELRRDLRWHDGKKVSGIDVCATVDALRSSQYPNPVGTRQGPWIRHCEVDASHPMTATLVLTDPNEPSSLQFPLLPHHLSGDLADPNHSLHDTPVGTGPWSAKTVEPLRLVPHRGHPGVRPTLSISVAPTDPDLGLAALTSGGVDGMALVRPDWVQTLREDPSLDLTPAPQQTAIYAALNPRIADDLRASLKSAVDRDELCADLVGSWPDALQAPCLGITGPYRHDDPRHNASARPQQGRSIIATTPLRVAIQSELEIDAQSLSDWLSARWSPIVVQTEIVPLQVLWTTSSEDRSDQWDVVVANLGPNDLPGHFDRGAPANWFNQAMPIDVRANTADASEGRALHAALEADNRWLFLVQVDGLAVWSPAHRPVWMTPWQGMSRAQDWGWFSGEAPDPRPNR